MSQRGRNSGMSVWGIDGGPGTSSSDWPDCWWVGPLFSKKITEGRVDRLVLVLVLVLWHSQIECRIPSIRH